MKKAFALLAFLHTLSFLFCQPDIEWKVAYGGSAWDFFSGIKPTSDGGYITIGASESNSGDATGNHGSSDFWVLKISSIGIVEWKKQFGGTGYDAGNSIEQTKDGGYIMTGFTESNNGQVSGYHGGTDAWVVKLSQSGAIEWQRSFGGSKYDIGQNIRQTDHDTYIFLAFTTSSDGDVINNDSEYGDVWLAELDLGGNILWQKTYGGSASDSAMDLKFTQDGGYILAGGTASSDEDIMEQHGESDIWLLKLDKAGNIAWSKTFGGSKSDELGFGSNALQILADGSYVVSGLTYSSDGQITDTHGMSDAWLIGVSASGELLWQKAFGGSGYDNFYAVQSSADGGMIMIGSSDSKDGDVTGVHGEYDFWLVKIDSLRALEWQLSIGGSKTDYGYTVLPAAGGGYLISGISESKNGDMSGISHPVYEAWVFKMSGGMVGVQERPDAVSLGIFPNPAGREIHFELPAGEAIESVRIMDMLGQNVWEQALQGEQVVDISFLRNGTYLVQAKTGSGEFFYGKFFKVE